MYKPGIRPKDFRWFKSFLTHLSPTSRSQYAAQVLPPPFATRIVAPKAIHNSSYLCSSKRSIGTALVRLKGGAQHGSSNHKEESRKEQKNDHNEKATANQSDEPVPFDQKKEPKTGSKRVLRRVNERSYEHTKQTCTAYCTAEKYDLDLANSLLVSVGYRPDPDSTGLGNQVIHLRLPLAPHAHSEPSVEQLVDPAHATFGDIFVFPSGVIVAWAMPEAIVNNIAKLIKPSAEDPKTETETENLEYVESSRHFKSFMRGDVIVIGTGNASEEVQMQSAGSDDEGSGSGSGSGGQSQQPVYPNLAQGTTTVLAKIAFSSGLARSTKLAVLETLLDRYLQSTADIPVMMCNGKLGAKITRGFMVRKTGELMMFRAQLNLYSELTDSLPDIFWDSRTDLGLEGCYQDVARELDVKVRISQLNEKLNYASQIAEVLREMLSEAHGFRLEWLIILLILFEVLCGIPNLLREMGLLKDKDSQDLDGESEGDDADFRQDIDRARQRVRAASQSLEKIFQNRNPSDAKQNEELAEAMEILKKAIDQSNETTLRVRRLRDQLRQIEARRADVSADCRDYSEADTARDGLLARVPNDIRRWGGW